MTSLPVATCFTRRLRSPSRRPYATRLPSAETLAKFKSLPVIGQGLDTDLRVLTVVALAQYL